MVVSALAASGTSGVTKGTLWGLYEQSLLILVGWVTSFWASGHFFNLASREEQSLDEKLTGYIKSYPSSTLSLQSLSEWVRLTQTETVDRVAKLISKEKLTGYSIDIPNGVIGRLQEPPSSSGIPSLLSTPIRAAVPTPSPGVSTHDEAMRIKARMYDLEMLKQQGKIGASQYQKLREEYERELSRLDSGTQVY